MPYYVKLSSSDVVESVTQTHAALAPAADLVEVDGLHEALLGKQYDRQASTPTAPVFVDVPAEPAPAPAWEWYIDLGPMSDRFGAASAAIDLSTEPGVVAVRSDFARRKWIDLKEPRVIAAINYLAGQAHPVLGTLATPLISAAVAAAALGTKPGLKENLALRKLYFGA